MGNYTGRSAEFGELPITETLFILGLALWIYCRLYIYPTKLLPSGLFESGPTCKGSENVCFVLKGFLILLQLMHIKWTYSLLRILFSGLKRDAGRKEYEGNSTGTDDD